MELTITISVTDSDTVSVQTKARDVSRAQILAALARAKTALQAEIDALGTCPWHVAMQQKEK